MTGMQRISALYLLVLLVAIYGFLVGRFNVFPSEYIEPLIEDLSSFTKGDEMERKSSPLQKLTNDLGLSFGRWFYSYPAIAAANTAPLDYAVEIDSGIEPIVYVNEAHRSGYRVIVGIVDLPDSFWGALLLNPNGEVIHAWKLSTKDITGSKVTDRIKNLYGLHVFKDGSIIFNMQERGGGIVKVDACSDVVWTLPGSFHHTVTPDEKGNFWSFSGGQSDFDQNMVLVDQDSGEIVSTIDMAEVRRKNPNLRIWDLYPLAMAPRADVRYQRNLTHGNDIEPLPLALAAQFPQFEAGDLIVSYATTNLVFVLDPDTLVVKWWRVGAGDLLHDVDWEPDGKITLFNNNSRRLFDLSSDIVAIDPATMELSVDVDGSEYDFFSVINGRHQLTPFDTRFVTSSTQGWAFEVNSNGDIVFSFVNNVDAQNKNSVHLSEALRYQEGYFNDDFWNTCDA